MNQHPIDRLADIRAEQRNLKREAADIRAKLQAGIIGAVGSRYVASRHSRVVLQPLPVQAPEEAAEGLDFDDWLPRL